MIDIKKPVHLLDIGKCKMPDDWKHYKRTCDHYIMYIVTEGKFYLKVEDKKYEFESGSVFLMKDNLPHEGFKEHAVIFYWLHFSFDNIRIVSEEQAKKYMTHSHNIHNKILFPEAFTMEHVENSIIFINQTLHFNASLKKQNQLTNYLSTTTLILLSNLYLSKKPLNDQVLNRRLTDICKYIDGNGRDNLDLKQIANTFNYNPQYLSKVFKYHIGISLKEYVIQSKLRNAEYMLLSTDNTIATIAKTCGYNNEFYFMRLFKKKYGITPSHYRNLYCNTKYTKYNSDFKIK